MSELWFASYSLYLESSEWEKRRDSMLSFADNCCEFCGVPGIHLGVMTEDDFLARPEILHVHHLTYENLGKEPMRDLIVLCNLCHRDVHEFPARKKHMLGYALYRRAKQGFLAIEDVPAEIERLWFEPPKKAVA